MLARFAALLALLVLFSLPQAGHAAKKVKPLRPATAIDGFHLEQDATFEARLGIGVKWRWGLRAGAYAAAYENDDGTFYEGQGTPVTSMMNDRHSNDYAGGIFVPRSESDRPYLYYYFKPNEATYRSQGALVAWIIKSGEGKIQFFPYKGPLEDPEFLEVLKTGYSPDIQASLQRTGAP